VSNIIVDAASRRDLLHMRMTTNSALIRYNGANHENDYTRLDDWVDRLEKWVDGGLQNIYFFVHQNIEKASLLLSVQFIKNINQRFGVNLKVPQLDRPQTLF